MEQTHKTTDQIHRVKRGRPAKPVDGKWSALASDAQDISVRIANHAKAPEGADVPDVEPVVIEPVPDDLPEQSEAQAYALRIWEGQSEDVSTVDRVARVVAGLRGQGLSIDVTLPHKDAARLLAKHA